MHCDSEVAARAEVVVYDYGRLTISPTYEMTFRPNDDPQDTDFFAEIDSPAPSEIVSTLAFDADGEFVCSVFR